MAQRIAVVSAIAKQPFGGLGTTDQALSRWTIVRVTWAQEDGKKTASSICHCMDFRIAPAA